MTTAWRRAFRTTGVLVAICCLLLCPAAARGQQTMGPYRDVAELPDTPAGKRVQEFVDVVNSGDAERQRAFCEAALAPAFRDAMPMDAHLGFLARFHEECGRLRFHSVRLYDEPLPKGEIVAILHAELPDSWRELRVQVGPEPPHLIAGMMIMPARPPSDVPAPGKLNEEALVAELGAFLDRLVAADRFSGAVLLAKDGKVLFKNAYGLASKRFDVPNRIDTKFNLGSMNKMFTAVAIGQLVERGKLSFDDSVSKYLSTDWLPRDVAEKITVRHLLTHTSGLGSYFNETFDKSSRMLFRDLDDYKPLVEGDRPAFEPGSGWQYSNTGFLLLGVIIEKVTGMSYFDYVQQNICGPAGMINTACYEMDRPVPNLAIGYSKVGRGQDAYWENNLYKHVIKG
ncbi:MAG: beta-lactamase family protein, partial [Phycisphaerales bacterium]